MTLRIFNSLSKETETFQPIEPNHVRMYVCGMTIYDYCHVGHARFMMAFDVAYRWLKTLGYEVTYVRNITDIDDKIIKRALERNIPIRQLTDEMTVIMHEDVAALGISAPTHEPRATQYVPQMLDMIGKLDPDAKAVGANYVSANYFKELGVSAAYGRLLDPALDDDESESPAVVLGHEFWQRYFNADPAVVGRTIRLNHQPATIVGVEPYGFPGLGNRGDSADIWLSIRQQPYFVSGSKALADTASGTVTSWVRLAP